MTQKLQILNLYKTILRTSEEFPTYNFRMYAIRRIKDAFKENKNLTDKTKILEAIEYGHTNLDIIKRQVIVGQLYSTEKLVIENQNN